MKLIENNPFVNCLAKLKKGLSDFSLETMLGKIKNIFWYDELYDEELDYEDEELENEEETVDMQEANGSLYHVSIHDVLEYKFILRLIEEGYVVITTLEMLTETEKEIFRRKLQMELFRYGIYCHKINNNNFVIAPTSVEIIDFEEKKLRKGQIINLADYRKK